MQDENLKKQEESVSKQEAMRRSECLDSWKFYLILKSGMTVLAPWWLF